MPAASRRLHDQRSQAGSLFAAVRRARRGTSFCAGVGSNAAWCAWRACGSGAHWRCESGRDWRGSTHGESTCPRASAFIQWFLSLRRLQTAVAGAVSGRDVLHWQHAKPRGHRAPPPPASSMPPPNACTAASSRATRLSRLVSRPSARCICARHQPRTTGLLASLPRLVGRLHQMSSSTHTWPVPLMQAAHTHTPCPAPRRSGPRQPARTCTHLRL